MTYSYSCYSVMSMINIVLPSLSDKPPFEHHLIISAQIF